jgi:hypothetical protein
MKTFHLVSASAGLAHQGAMHSCLRAARILILREREAVFQLYSVRPDHRGQNKNGRLLGTVSQAGFVSVGQGRLR